MHSAAYVPSSRSKALSWKRILLCIGVAFFILCLPFLIGGVYAAVALRHAYADLKTTQTFALTQQFSEARTSIQSAQTSLDSAERGLSWIGPWRYVPVISSHVKTVQESAEAAKTTLQGVDDLLDVAELVQQAFADVGVGSSSVLGVSVASNRSFRDLSSTEKQQILGRVAAALPKIRLAQEKMRIAADKWDDVPRGGLLTPIRTQLDARIQQFRAAQQQLDGAVRLAEVLLPFSGYPTPKKYLVLLQNNQEMRGTGGFIGTVGEVWLDSGDVQKMIFQDVYSLDLPVSGVWNQPSPAPIAHWLEQKNLFFRDANWSPDFAQTAQRLLQQYRDERTANHLETPPLDGIIAFEPGFFRNLMRVIGPVQIEDQEFTADNFFDAIQYDVHRGFAERGVPRAQRKEVVAKLGDAVFQKLISQPASAWPALLDVAMNAFQQKDILVYAQDPIVQRLLDDRDWSGRTKATPDDFLWVVDTNMGAWKTDGVMNKQILYRVDAAKPGEAIATVTLRYTNTNLVPNWRYTRYRTYSRVYVPEGSELLGSTGAMMDDLGRTQGRLIPGSVDVYHELGKTVFGAFFAVEPGKTGELRFTYRLPPSVVAELARGRYELQVQKQPGTQSLFSMEATVPRTLTSADPPERPIEFGDARYRQTLSLMADQLIRFGF